MAHEDESGAVLSSSVQTVETGGLDGLGGDGLGDSFLVGVDDGGIGADLAEHRLCDGDGFKLILVCLDGFAHLVILRTVHQVRRLDDKILHAIGNCTVERLGHVVDLLAVTGLDVVDDDLRGEGAADGPVGVRGLQGVFDALDVGHAAVVEGRAEGDDQQLVFADLVLVAGVIQRGVAGVAAEVLGAGFLALDELLLRVGQRVPRGLGRFALRVGVIGALLHVDGVDERGDVVGGFLIEFFLRGLLLGGLLGFFGRRLFLCGCFGGLLFLGRLLCGGFGLAAGSKQAQQHHGCEQECDGLFHGDLPLFKNVLKKI